MGKITGGWFYSANNNERTRKNWNEKKMEANKYTSALVYENESRGWAFTLTSFWKDSSPELLGEDDSDHYKMRWMVICGKKTPRGRIFLKIRTLLRTMMVSGHLQVGGSWAWSPIMTTCRAPRVMGISTAGSMACVASSTSTWSPKGVRICVIRKHANWMGEGPLSSFQLYTFKKVITVKLHSGIKTSSKWAILHEQTLNLYILFFLL